MRPTAPQSVSHYMKNWKIFVINLTESTERLNAFETHYACSELPFERIEAEDGRELSAEEIAQCYRFEDSDYYKELNAGEIGCYLSHAKVWQKIIKQQLDFAIVLEDDAIVSEFLADAIQSLSVLDQEWDLIKLVECPIKRKAVHQSALDRFSLVTYNKVPKGTQGQAVSYSGAVKLLQQNGRADTDTIQRPIDIDMQYWWERKLKVFGLKPYPVSVSSVHASDIDNKDSRQVAKKSVWRQIKTRIYFLFKNKKELKKRLKELK